MTCGQARAALSAEIDGEAVVIGDAVRSHLEGCDACREWRELAHRVTRSARLGAALPSADLADRIVRGIQWDARERRVRRQWVAVFAGVAAVGFVQVLATVPLLLLARGSGRHAGTVLGVVEASIGAAFFIGAAIVLWRTRDGSTLHSLEAAGAEDRAGEPGLEGRVA